MVEEKTKDNQDSNNESTKKAAYLYCLEGKTDEDAMYHFARLSPDETDKIDTEFLAQYENVSDDKFHGMRKTAYSIKGKGRGKEVIKRVEKELHIKPKYSKLEAKVEN